MAAQSGNYKIARSLLLRGINRKLQNSKGFTAYDISKSLPNSSVSKILVRNI